MRSSKDCISTEGGSNYRTRVSMGYRLKQVEVCRGWVCWRGADGGFALCSGGAVGLWWGWARAGQAGHTLSLLLLALGGEEGRK